MAKKKKHCLTAKQLEKYKDLLLEKRQEILADVCCIEENVFQSGGELSSMPLHMADIGTDSYEQEFSLGLMAEERKNLFEIQQALLRIDQGTFGICEGLGIPIEENRLEAIPWARYSMEYARMKEKGIYGAAFIKRRPIDIKREEEPDEEDLSSDDSVLDTDVLDLEESPLDDQNDPDNMDQDEEDYDH